MLGRPDISPEKTPAELVEEVIFPFWLDNLNRAKMAYLSMPPPGSDSGDVSGTYNHYFSAIRAGRILDIGITPEVELAIEQVSEADLISNPKVALVLEHESYITTLWVRYFHERMGASAVNTWMTQRLYEEPLRFEVIRQKGAEETARRVRGVRGPRQPQVEG